MIARSIVLRKPLVATEARLFFLMLDDRLEGQISPVTWSSLAMQYWSWYRDPPSLHCFERLKKLTSFSGKKIWDVP
jgi:hypothetical protein